MSKYYIYTDGVVRGPFPLENIASMFAEGKVVLNTPLSMGKGTPWQTVQDHPEIMETAARQKTYTKNSLSTPSIPNITTERVVFYCPKCRQKYAGGASWIGRDVVCNNCGEIFVANPQDNSKKAAPDTSAAPTGRNTEKNTTDPAAKQEKAIAYESAFADISEGDVICPHCWHRFSSEQILYISTHPSLMGDPVLGANAMKRFSPTKFNALGQALDDMSMAATDAACPHCRLKIPLTVIDEKNLYFSLVGAPSSGKSYFLATLLNVLRRTLPNDFACTLLDVDPELNRVLDSYEETIFHTPRRHEVAVLPKTQQTGDDFVNVVELDNIPVHLPKPFVYELKHLAGNDKEDCNVIFYDNAGEQFEPGADNMINPGTRHMACSDGIIFVFDPINDAMMRDICNQDDPQLKTDEHVYEQTKLLSEMIARIRRHRNLSNDAKCAIPLVIAVGKYDAWQQAFPRHLASLPTMDRQPGKLAADWCRNTILDVSFELRELLMKYAPSLISTAEGFFETVYLIPFSSFGCPASTAVSGQLGVVPGKVKPVWAAEPFLALLAENDMIDTAPVPVAENPLQADTIGEFIIFNHPQDGHCVRLPKNYSGAVLTIAGKTYQLPTHRDYIVKKSANKKDSKSGNSDLWS